MGQAVETVVGVAGAAQASRTEQAARTGLIGRIHLATTPCMDDVFLQPRHHRVRHPLSYTAATKMLHTRSYSDS